MGKFDTADYSFSTHAKHWGEMKGFALGLQFNPRSPMTDADFISFHMLVGDAPVLHTATASDIADYKSNLVDARDLLANAYGFDTENMGDEEGENGW